MIRDVERQNGDIITLTKSNTYGETKKLKRLIVGSLSQQKVSLVWIAVFNTTLGLCSSIIGPTR